MNKYNWCYSTYCLDAELMAHLDGCVRCRSLIRAEEALRNNFQYCRQAKPQSKLTLETVRKTTETARSRQMISAQATGLSFRELLFGPRFRTYKLLGIGAVVVLVAVLAFVPFSFREKVGYEIAIAGVERSIAEDNQDITPLLRALGMEQDQATNLLDSLGTERIRLYVGECSETCHLRISDLKTEHDVRLVVNAIIALGCCQIDKIVPIFRNESISLLRYVVRKL